MRRKRMIAVGVDTHKHEHLARALDGLGQLVGGVTIKADAAGYLEPPLASRWANPSG